MRITNAREEATKAQRSPHEDLSIQDLKELIHSMAGKRTRKQSRQALLDMLHDIENGDQSFNAGIIPYKIQ